jgi:hypothetical protein
MTENGGAGMPWRVYSVEILNAKDEEAKAQPGSFNDGLQDNTDFFLSCSLTDNVQVGQL